MEPSLLEEYDEWLAEHLEELVVKYPAKVIALHKGSIVFVGNLEARYLPKGPRIRVRTNSLSLSRPA